ncbi:MAG: DUF429 domain-containing protein [Nitriliruptoraceae bacterium]
MDDAVVVVLDWSLRTFRIDHVHPVVTDDELLALLRDPRTDVAGVTAPVGWPIATAQPSTADMTPEANDRRRVRIPSTTRVTDRWMLENVPSPRHGTGFGPVRFGAAALRTHDLLEQLPAFCVDRTGRNGKIVEARPQVALRAWKLPHSGYDLPGPDGRHLLQAAMSGMADGMGLTPDALGVTDADQFDALVAALVAGMARTGLTVPIPPEHVATAIVEGWTHLPVDDSLKSLIPASRRTAA